MTEGAGAESTGLLEQVASMQQPSPIDVMQHEETVLSSLKNNLAEHILSANNQTDKQAINQTIRQTIKQAIEQTEEQSNHHLNDQTINQSNNQTDNQSPQQAPKQTTKSLVQQTIKQYDGQSNQQSKYIWLPLNEKQGRILLFLYENGGGLTNMDIICMDTEIAYGTARNAIDVLIREGYVTNKNRHNGHLFRGFEYTLNNHLCSLYVSRIRDEQSHKQPYGQSPEQSFQQTIKQLGNQANKQSNNQTNNQTKGAISSKVFKEDLNLTTTGTGIFDDPELKFWKGEGVTEKQVQNWMTEFQLSHDEIVMSLRYGRFDILERGDVNNSANWFYKILTRNGFYPKPANYRSLPEIKAEALLQQQERDREAKAKIEEVEFEAKFQAFLEDSDSPLFKELFDKIGSFAKEQFRDGERMAAEIALKDLFKIYLKTA